jgi:hypothetical protein
LDEIEAKEHWRTWGGFKPRTPGSSGDSQVDARYYR